MTSRPLDSETRDALLDEAILAYLQEVDAGRTPDLRTFAARFPAVAAELEAFLADHRRVGRLTQPLRPGGPPGETMAESEAAVATAGPLPGPIGGYRPLRLLGVGGMGRVYEAEDASGRRVALKLLSPALAGSRTAVERLRQEGRLASAISHPRCVFVLTADEEAGQPYVVMELMPGTTLKDLVERDGPLAPTDAVAKVLDVIEGLDEAHRAGVLHRDVKPANCYLDATGRVKVGDFGLARSLTASAQLTQPGGFVGTPLFASPEQLRGDRLDARTDVYSVAATLYFLLTGRAPFHGADGMAVIARVVSEAPPPVRGLRPEVSPALEQIVMRGLERTRERRFADLGELREALLPLLPGQLSIAGLSLRVGAYLLDCLPFSILGATLEILHARESAAPSLTAYLVTLVPMFFYFWLTEGLWGWTPAKRLVRLRVTGATGCEPPGLGKALLRMLVLLATAAVPVDLVLFALGSRIDPLTWALVHLAAVMVGLALRFCTMRASNGYRGLHEILSATRVVQLPAAPEASLRRPAGQRVGETVTAACRDSLPHQVGGFAVRGLVAEGRDGTVLVGEDTALGRHVWLWRRPASAPPLAAGRRELARSTRLRWLGCGEDGASRWDAFVAPAGEPLAQRVAAGGPLGWDATRRVLEPLAEELQAAAGDGTLPPSLAPGQVYVDASGRVQLLEWPGCGAGKAHGAQAVGLVAPNGGPISLLRDVATLALEGRFPQPEQPPRAVRAVVPLHARAILDRLAGIGAPYTDAAAVAVDLAVTRGRPAEVTPSLRALHLAVSSVFLIMGLCLLFAWSRVGAVGGLMALDNHAVDGQALLQTLADDGLRPQLLAALPPDDPLGTDPDRYPELLGAQVERDRRELAGRLESLGSVGMITAVRVREARVSTDGPFRMERIGGEGFTLRLTQGREGCEVTGFVNTKDLRRAAARADGTDRGEDPRLPWGLFLGGLVLVGLAPALWVLSAFAFRGGLSLRLAGLALVRPSGRPALRVQCAWRALVVWLPVVTLLFLVVGIDTYYRDLTWLAPPLQGLAAVVLLGYVPLILCFPRRGPHDWLAGTWVVPR